MIVKAGSTLELTLVISLAHNVRLCGDEESFIKQLVIDYLLDHCVEEGDSVSCASALK